MNPGHTIARLEALLERVQARAAQPRVASRVRAAEPEPAPPPAKLSPAQAPAPSPAVAQAPAPSPLAQSPAPSAARDPITIPPPAFVLDEPVDDLETTQSRAVPSRQGRPGTETEIVVEVEVQASTNDSVLAVPVEESSVPEALDSRERLVAAEPAPEATTEAVVEAAAPQIKLELDEPEAEAEEAAPEVVSTEETLSPDQVEELEEAPVSSRRPLAPPPGERLEEMAFGAVEPEPPRHTPPPESGRLPAAPEVEFDGDITGVRDAKSGHPPAAAVAEIIVPEVTMAVLDASDEVAEIAGSPQPPAPITFLAALDASLAL